MNDYKELIDELRRKTKYCDYPETMLKAADAIEQLVKERDAAVEELKMLEKHIGKAIPKRCKTCELWGKRGWSQFEVGYCEGDDNPHSPNDFCSRWRGVTE